MINWAQQEFDAERFEMAYASTSHCFDLSIFEMFYPLSIGKPVRLLENALAIESALAQDRKVLINTVPSSMRNLLDRGCNLEQVVMVNLAGESFPVDLGQRLLQAGVEVRNLYGPSEDTTYSTGYRLSADRKYTASIPIGRPISNTSAYILDAYLHPVPVGIPGRIFLAGDGLATGYLNKPEKTMERFIDDPFKDGERMYDTGDWGKWLPDGNIDYLGRQDDQVKIRGYRIELGEIEHVLSQFSVALQQVVLQVAEMGGDQKLVAYYTTVQAEPLDKSAMKAFLAERLPHFMIPNYFKELAAMPLNSNGKIDKKALPPILEDD
ncbi:MAG: AMP-binding protein, partial [Phaeodactylibacter sp.]|nr:AMP-binding protein [Phaeodactylibacter sp.]